MRIGKKSGKTFCFRRHGCIPRKPKIINWKNYYKHNKIQRREHRILACGNYTGPNFVHPWMTLAPPAFQALVACSVKSHGPCSESPHTAWFGLPGERLGSRVAAITSAMAEATVAPMPRPNPNEPFNTLVPSTTSEFR